MPDETKQEWFIRNREENLLCLRAIQVRAERAGRHSEAARLKSIIDDIEILGKELDWKPDPERKSRDE